MDPVSYVLAVGVEAAETLLVRPNQASSLIAFFSLLLKFVHRLKLIFLYTAISVGLGLNNRLSYLTVTLIQWNPQTQRILKFRKNWFFVPFPLFCFCLATMHTENTKAPLLSVMYKETTRYLIEWVTGGGIILYAHSQVNRISIASVRI
jgi:hypothetical protein